MASISKHYNTNFNSRSLSSRTCRSPVPRILLGWSCLRVIHQLYRAQSVGAKRDFFLIVSPYLRNKIDTGSNRRAISASIRLPVFTPSCKNMFLPNNARTLISFRSYEIQVQMCLTKRCAKDRSDQRICSHSTGSVLQKRIDDIIQGWEEDHVNAESDQCDAYHTPNPVNFWICRHSKDEQSNTIVCQNSGTKISV